MKEMRSAVILLSVLSFVSAGTLIYFSSLNKSISFWLFYAVLAVFCVLAAITYTVGKRAYGYHGLGDFFVFIFFGFVSVVGVYHLYLSEFSFSTFQFENLLPASTIGFLSMAVLNLNNMRDRTNDANVGKRTLVVKLGGERAKFYHAFLILGGIACFTIYVFQFQSENKWMTLSLLPLIFLIAHLRKAMSIVQERNFDPELKKVALSAFALSVLFALAIVLNTSF
jgi:1,4-dihydroxy-2-naphthoate octaprenyltransferase